ncbi:MAG: DUF192 domain-containing protein [Patescibacteria group bacterium]|nr:DUF192 domain-containing protein [Patescibacteria group bacterium]
MRTISLRIKQGHYLEKVVGLIGRKKPYALFFKTRFGIHTFGVTFPIDVVILDNQQRIVKMKTVTPNLVFFWNPVFDGVLELPTGTIEKEHMQVGDTIRFTY